MLSILMWFLIALGVLFWWLCGQSTSNRRKMQQIARDFPTNIPEMPLIGHAYLYLGNDEDRMKAIQRFARDTTRQGGVIATRHCSQTYIWVTDAEIADLLVKSCLDKDENTTRFLRMMTGNGSIFAPVKIWRPRRKILAPVFSPKNINGFVEIFARQSSTMVGLLQPRAGAGDFSIWKYVTTYTFDAVSESNLGIKMNSQEQEDHPFIEAFEKSTELIATRMVQPWLYSDNVYRLLPSYWKCRRHINYLCEFVDEIIKEKRKWLKTNGCNEHQNTNEMKSHARTFLEMLIESSEREKGYNDLELREEILVILGAGTDTSAVGVCFVICLLSRYPDIQDAVYKELDAVYGNSDRRVVLEDLRSLQYLEAVIKETLRLYPPVPAITREIRDDVNLPSRTTLVKGLRIAINIWGIHRNPRYWGEDAEEFRPERFLEGPLKHPAQFISFSQGMRNCLGYKYAMMSMKTVLASLLRRYRVLPPAGLDPAHYQDPLRVKFDVMMRHVDNFVVRLEERT